MLSYRQDVVDARDILNEGGAALSLHCSSLTASLDYGAAPPKLGLTVRSGATAGITPDGLIGELAPGGRMRVDFDFSITLDTTNGLTFGAGSHQRITIPNTFSVPGVDLRDLGISMPLLPSGNGGAPSSPTFSLDGTLIGKMASVVETAIDGFGIELHLDPGKLLAGQQPLSLGLRIPTGLGIQIDAGPVRGGGYLFDKDSEYGGALDLTMGPIELKAIAIISTDPFSLIVLLSVEFIPPIQLGMGFTLNGVGGLLAVERMIATDALHNATVCSISAPSISANSFTKTSSAMR